MIYGRTVKEVSTFQVEFRMDEMFRKGPEMSGTTSKERPDSILNDEHGVNIWYTIGLY